MSDKKSFALNILNNLGKQANIKNNGKVKSKVEPVNDNEVKLDLNSFIMVPTNHPRIKEILDILNSNIEKESIETKEGNVDSSKNNKKIVITLNDVKDSLSNNTIEIPKGSIITPLAKDYIKERKIKVINILEKVEE